MNTLKEKKLKDRVHRAKAMHARAWKRLNRACNEMKRAARDEKQAKALLLKYRREFRHRLKHIRANGAIETNGTIIPSDN